ncbi:MAG: S8 family serine peptidase [Oligoflexia bacterium]|nr:S8 family serine peptidase [Oligoflexia bacterium]
MFERFHLYFLIGVCAVSTLCLSGCRARAPAEENPSWTPQPTPTATIRPLQLVPTGSTSLSIGKRLRFSVSGGIPPYSFASTSGSVGATGEFQAPYHTDLVTVTVTDSRGAQTQTLVSIVAGSLLLPNDPMFSLQSALSREGDQDIDAPEAWALHQDCRSILVAVLDSGIDTEHPDLAANLWTNPEESYADGVDGDGNGFADDSHGWNFVGDNNDIMDENLHGTHVAGIIGAVGNNGIGVSGVCWRASLAAVKFLDADGVGTSSDAVDAIDYAIGIGAKVINASFGGNTYNQAVKDALDRANSAGILFVSAAGNETSDNDTIAYYPGNYDSPNIVTVAATTETDSLASYSNYGVTQVDLAAPGSNVLSTFPTVATPEMVSRDKTSNYERLNGTSMAAPLVAGAAALVWSFEPALTHLQVRARLLERADPVTALEGKISGARRLNLRKAIYVP